MGPGPGLRLTAGIILDLAGTSAALPVRAVVCVRWGLGVRGLACVGSPLSCAQVRSGMIIGHQAKSGTSGAS